MPERPSKPCAVCGRQMQWRKKWEKNWDAVKYCSDACRRSGVGAADGKIEKAILGLLNQRDATSTICPSEVARAIAGEGDWRPLMEPVRRAARRLVHRGAVRITQRGRTVTDPSRVHGPIRLARPL